VTRRNLAVLGGALFLWVFGFGLYDDLFPIYARSLGATPLQLGFLFTVRQLVVTAGSVLGGVLADRYSRRAVMLPSWLLATPTPLLFLVAPSWPWLLPGVILYDITIFGLPAMNAYVAERTDPRRLASTFAALTAASSLGMLLSPTLGGLVTARFGFRITFLLALLCYASSTVLIYQSERQEPDARRPLPWRQALRFWDLSGLWPLLIALGLLTGVPLALAPFLSPFLREVRGLGLAQIGALGSVMAGGSVLFTLLAGRAADRWGDRPVLLLVAVLIAIGAAVIVRGPLLLLPLAFLVRGRSAVMSLSHAVLGARVAADAAGRAFGLYGMLAGVAGAVGTLLAGAAYRADPALPFLAGAAAVAVPAVVVLIRRAAAVRPAAVE
jgi:MFS family permease